MKKSKIKVEKVHDLYTANGVPFEYAYWTEEDRDPCPECGSRVRLVEGIMDVDYFCPFCNKYVEPKCECGECVSHARPNRPNMLPEFRKKRSPIEAQPKEEIASIQGWADELWLRNMLDKIHIYEQWKYLNPTDVSLEEKKTTIIRAVVASLSRGKNELSSLLYFKAAIKIIMAELKDSLYIEIYTGIIGQIDTLVQNKNYLDNDETYASYEYKEFYEKIVRFHYPDEIEDPEDRFDSMYAAEAEKRKKDLNTRLEEGWSERMKRIKSEISEILTEGGEVAGMLGAYISLYEVDEFINHLLEQQKKLNSEIYRYESMNGDQEAQLTGKTNTP